MKMTWLGRKYLRWALTAVLLVIGGAAVAVLMMRSNVETSASGNDCDVVERLGREWITTVQSVKASVEAGERSDLLAAADREQAMSEKLRAAANSVSTPGFKEQFNKWADGAALSAQIQRGSIDRSHKEELPADLQAQMHQAAVMTDEASGALLAACPNVREKLKG